MTNPAELDSHIWEAHMRVEAVIADLYACSVEFIELDTARLAIDERGVAIGPLAAVDQAHAKVADAARSLAAASTALTEASALTSRLRYR